MSETTTTEVSAASARANWAATLDASRTEPVTLTRHGRAVGVLISPDLWERALEAMEDAEDLAAARASLAEEGESIPWQQVKADLGLAAESA